MSSSLKCLLLFVGMLAIAVPSVSSIMCYQCNSQVDDGCRDIHRNDTESDYYKECTGDYEGEDPFCRKTVQELKLHLPRVIRGCGWKNHTVDCYHSDDGHHIEKVCQCFSDGCNLATALSSSGVFGVVFIATASLLLTRA